MEVVTELRARWPASTVRIVAVTADAFEDTRDQARAAAPAQPLTPAQLSLFIRRRMQHNLYLKLML